MSGAWRSLIHFDRGGTVAGMTVGGIWGLAALAQPGIRNEERPPRLASLPQLAQAARASLARSQSRPLAAHRLSPPTRRFSWTRLKGASEINTGIPNPPRQVRSCDGFFGQELVKEVGLTELAGGGVLQ